MALGRRVRRTMIMPLCKKHNLKFWSGNGDYWFEIAGKDKYTFPDDRIGTALDAIEAGLDYLVEVFKLLDAEVSYNAPFGCYVESVLA